MRDYAKAFATFWTGKTGKRLRGDLEAQVLAAYLFTGPHRHPMGLYYIAIPTICHETGLSAEGASKALRRLSEETFAHYDEASEVIWVPEMAKHQIGESLKPNDKMVAWINREYQSLPSNRFLRAFFDKYVTAYHIRERRTFKAPSKPLQSPIEANHITITSPNKQEQRQKELSPPGDLTLNGWGTPEALVALYNAETPDEFPAVEKLSEARRKKARQYLAQFPDREFWVQVFAQCRASPFLRGLRPGKGHEKFRGSLDWLLSKGEKDAVENCVKCYEGKYGES